MNDPLHRSFIYQYLALGFDFPQRSRLSELSLAVDDLQQALVALALDPVLGDLESTLSAAEKDPLDLQGRHNALFATRLEAPACEGAYELDKTAGRAAMLADVQGFYRAFGLRLSPTMPPDALVAELEFLAVLNQKALYAHHHGETQGRNVCQDAAHAFLADHMGRWYAIFTERLLAAASANAYYRQLARLLRAFLDLETKELPKNRQTLQQLRKQDSQGGGTWPCTKCIC